MIPLIDKNAFGVITQQMTPEEAKYVVDVQNVLSDAQTNQDISEEDSDDVIYVAKIMAFTDKFKVLHWAATSMSYHKAIDEFYKEMEAYKDAIAENIQAIIGQFVTSQFTKVELPIGDNPLDVINELKICVNNWFLLHKDDMEYEGCRNATSGFLEVIKSYVYQFRLCKISQD